MTFPTVSEVCRRRVEMAAAEWQLRGAKAHLWSTRVSSEELKTFYQRVAAVCAREAMKNLFGII